MANKNMRLFKMRLCKYRNLLGKPGQGIHSFQIGGIAVTDVILTVLGAILIAWLSKANFFWVLLGLFGLGVALHWLFCVPTTMNKMLGLV